MKHILSILLLSSIVACGPVTNLPVSKPGERETLAPMSSPRPQPRPETPSPSYADRLDSPEVEMSVMKQALQTKERVFERMTAEPSDVGYMP